MTRNTSHLKYQNELEPMVNPDIYHESPSNSKLPIAIRKQTQTCILHSILSFVCYKNSFLNEKLEEVLMIIPPGICKGENNVCKLKKSFYGLKQLPRALFDKFTKVMKKRGYQ